MTQTLTDEDGRVAHYTITPNHGGLTMTVKTQEAKFDAEALISAWIEPADAQEISRWSTIILIREAYAQGLKDAVPDGAMLADQWRMNWLSLQHVEVRGVLLYGSKAIFRADPPSGSDWEADEDEPSDIRSKIDAAMLAAAGVK